MKKLIAACCCLFWGLFPASAHSGSSLDGVNKVRPDTIKPILRKSIVAAGSLAALAGAVVLPAHKSSSENSSAFHVNQSASVWLGLDKIVHAQISYATTRMLHGALLWAGLPEKKAVVLSSAGSLVFGITKEYMDGHHKRKGWSWRDMGANLAGVALFSVQQLAFGEQKLQLKLSGFVRKYDQPELETEARYLFGNGLKRLVKDYNQQTYWLSANVNSLGIRGIPPWLNLAVGTGGENLFGASQNKRNGSNGTVVFDRRDLKRQRQWYLSPDIDLTKIPTKSRFLKTAFFVLNSFKVPLPALALTGGKLQFKAIAF